MSYIAKKGKAAFESMNAEEKDYSKVLVPFKSGSTYKVRVPSVEDYVEWFAHSVYGKFFTTPCTKPTGKADLYDQAVDLLYQDAREAQKAGDEAKAKELRDQAYSLKAKPRYLFGFFNLEDGAEIIVDLTRAQARAVVAAIEEYAQQINQFAFKLTKTGTGTATQVSLAPIISGLSDTEREHFEATAGKEFDESLYGKVLQINSEEKQIEDLRKFGFDVSRLGVGEAVQPVADVGEDDFPF